MFARNVSFYLKPNTLSDYTRSFEKTSCLCCGSRMALRTKSLWPVPAELM